MIRLMISVSGIEKAKSDDAENIENLNQEGTARLVMDIFQLFDIFKKWDK